jgi:hypothetical protein
MTPIERVLACLPGHQKNGVGWKAKCPSHDDNSPSLSVSAGDDGRALLHCFAGCDAETITTALGLKMVDLMPESDRRDYHTPKPQKSVAYWTANAAVEALEKAVGSKRSAFWVYENSQGEKAGIVVRWDSADGKKIRQASKQGDGWACCAMSSPRPLYQLPLLATAETVVIVEGEKCADVATSLGYVATTSAGGSQASSKSDWSPLAGKLVVIFPDNDEPGRKYALGVASILHRANPNTVVKIVDLPGLADKEDLADWVAQFKGEYSTEALREELGRLIETAPIHEEPAEPQTLLETEPGEPTKKDENPFLVKALDSAAFDNLEQVDEWLIDNVLIVNEPMILAGPSKTLKTSIAIDAAVSMASGRSFLGKYRIPNPKNVFVLSAESGAMTLKKLARRVCEAKKVQLRELGKRLYWFTQVETLVTATGRENLSEALKAFECSVVVLDPAYLLLGGEVTSDKASNFFAMGELLARIGDACLKAGATPIILTHSNGKIQTGSVMELTHIGWSGFQQWARQWWLINRISDYKDDGRHELHFRFGGSAGHTGLDQLHIDEGVIPDRKWEVDCVSGSEARRRADAESEEANSKADEEDRDRTYKAIVRITGDGVTTVASRKKLKEITELSDKRLNKATRALEENGSIKHLDDGIVKAGRGTKPSAGWARSWA